MWVQFVCVLSLSSVDFNSVCTIPPILQDYQGMYELHAKNEYQYNNYSRH